MLSYLKKISLNNENVNFFFSKYESFSKQEIKFILEREKIKISEIEK
jgi:hypothetical protein